MLIAIAAIALIFISFCPVLVVQWAAKILRASQLIAVQPVFELWQKTILTPAFFIVLGFTLLMEQLLPVQKKARFWTVSFAQDLVWFFYEAILHAAVIVTFIAWLMQFYYAHCNFLTIYAANRLPGWARFVFGVLALDFLYWLQHWINHKVPWLWQFHAVHHSQKELSFFSDFRYHVFEYVIRETIMVVPFLILQVDIPTIVYFSVFRSWYTRFYHGNIKINMGPLRYILVTPQSHRVHHSIELRHYDQNFGSLFSIWDFLFGTQYKGFDEYPQTGIPDPEFPHEKTKGLSLLLTPLIQLAYPFRRISQQIRQMIRPKP